MLEEEGIRNIYNKPSWGQNYYNSGPYLPPSKNFRGTANPVTKILNIPSVDAYSGDADQQKFKYFDKLIAETAHIPEFWRKETFNNIFETINSTLSFTLDKQNLKDWISGKKTWSRIYDENAYKDSRRYLL